MRSNLKSQKAGDRMNEEAPERLHRIYKFL